MNLVQNQILSGAKKLEEALRAVAQGYSGAIGEAFFQHLVQHLASTLQADYVFIGELKPGPSSPKVGDTGNSAPVAEIPQAIRTLAVSAHQKVVDNFEYPLPGTPCETVVNKQLCCY